ncbi:MAG: hypothetical protein HFH82_10135 [Lachnospiraceae bacterium]|nr:hypothetical protein [Lachnospiraceae bacterium]
MVPEERMKLLMKRVEEEYKSILKNADFTGENCVEEARKVVIADMIFHNLDLFLAGSPGEVEVLLFHDHPLKAFYDSLPERDLLLLNGVMEALEIFLKDTRRHIKDLYKQWGNVPLDEVKKAQEFFAMEDQLEEGAKKEYQEKIIPKQEHIIGQESERKEDELGR